MTSGTKKFGPAFCASKQQEILTSLSAFMQAKGVSFPDFKDTLLVPDEPSSVHIRFQRQPDEVLKLESSEHVRFVRGVLNDPTQRNRVSFAAHKQTGYPHGIVAKPTEW